MSTPRVGTAAEKAESAPHPDADFKPDELNGILNWIEQLDEVDVQGVEPMTSNVHQPLRLRDDVVTDGGKVDRVLSNAPKSADGFFVVPKVVE